MDELVERLVADLWIDRAAAEKTAGIVCDSSVRERPVDKVRPPLATPPGAEALMHKAANDNAGGCGTASGVIAVGATTAAILGLSQFV